MEKRTVWLIFSVLLAATIGVLLAFAQQDAEADITIEDLYRLLTTEDGRSRLDVLEEWVMDIDAEVDIIHAVAEKMLEEQYGFFDQEQWTLDDLKFQLNTVEALLQDVKNCLHCP